MPPRRRGPKLSPAERKLEKARKKAERKLAKEEAKRQERREHLARELGYGELSWKHLEEKFRDFAMKIRMPQLREQVEAAWRFFEHAVDCKNLVISRQLDELEHNEEDHRVVQQKHVEATDEIMKIFKKQLDELREDFETRKANILQENQELFDEMADELNREEEGLQLNMVLMKERNEESCKSLSALRFFTENEEKNEAAMALVSLRERIEKDMDDTWAQIKAILEIYLRSTEEPKQEYEVLNTKDKNARRILESRLKKTKKLHDDIKKLKDKLGVMQDLSEVTLTKLQDERQYFDDLFKALCKRVRDEKALDHNQLATLATACNNTIKWLKTKADKGESVLKLAQACQELETEDEKVIPFRYRSRVSETEEDEQDEDEKTEKDNIITTKIWKDIHGLENFWQKVSVVELKYANMLREAELLVRENNDLRDVLQQYLKVMAQSHKVLLN